MYVINNNDGLMAGQESDSTKILMEILSKLSTSKYLSSSDFKIQIDLGRSG